MDRLRTLIVTVKCSDTPDKGGLDIVGKQQRSDVPAWQLRSEIDRVKSISKTNIIAKILSTVFQKELDKRDELLTNRSKPAQS